MVRPPAPGQDLSDTRPARPGSDASGSGSIVGPRSRRDIGVACRCAGRTECAAGPSVGFGGSAGAKFHFKEHSMGLGTILLIVLILVLIGVIPTWPHSRSWGYAPGGIVGLIVVVLVVLLLTGRL
jgi:hypothetical protein